LTLIGRDATESNLGEWSRVGSITWRGRAGCNEKQDYALRSPMEFIYNSTAPWGEVVSHQVFGTNGPDECIVWDSSFETPSLPSFRESLLRSATVRVKFGIKVGAMLSSVVLSLVCFVGCNSDEGTPAAGTGPAAGSKPAGEKPAAPAPKPDDKK
jgi:hypothetical protein